MYQYITSVLDDEFPNPKEEEQETKREYEEECAKRSKEVQRGS
jgi:hypothetical protein